MLVQSNGKRIFEESKKVGNDASDQIKREPLLGYVFKFYEITIHSMKDHGPYSQRNLCIFLYFYVFT